MTGVSRAVQPELATRTSQVVSFGRDTTQERKRSDPRLRRRPDPPPVTTDVETPAHAPPRPASVGRSDNVHTHLLQIGSVLTSSSRRNAMA